MQKIFFSRTSAGIRRSTLKFQEFEIDAELV